LDFGFWISNFGFWILDFGLRDLGLLQEVYRVLLATQKVQETGASPESKLTGGTENPPIYRGSVKASK
jgi:hypothetical protein